MYEICGVGVDLALQKDTYFGDPRFLCCFLKGIIIAREVKINHRFFHHQISFNIVYSKNKFQFSTNCQNIACSILSKRRLIDKLAYFLEGLKS